MGAREGLAGRWETGGGRGRETHGVQGQKGPLSLRAVPSKSRLIDGDPRVLIPHLA